MAPVEKFRVLLLGDFAYGESYAAGARIIQERGREYSTEKLLPFVQACDRFVLNLETPLVPDADLTSEMREKRPWLHWADPEKTGAALIDLGVDAVSLANNHTVDQGEQGLLDSLKTLESLGIQAFGAGIDTAHAESPLELPLPEEFGGGAINIHAALELRNDYGEYGFYANETKPGNAAISAKRVPAVDGPVDTFHLAFPHWGRNYAWVSPRQRRIAREFSEAGYDLVVGAGAHTIQELGRENSLWIVYSIGNGNFQSPGRWRKYEREAGILPFGFWTVLDITPPDGGGVRRVGLNLYPVYSDNRKTDFQPYPVNKEDFERTVRTLTARAIPPGSFPNGAVQLLEDDLGRFIRLEVADWPIGGAPKPIEVVIPAPEKTVMAKVQGPRVQRVGFGRWIRDHARRLGVMGWARNREDYLEVLLQGDEDAVAELERLLATGPDTAQVDRVDSAETRQRSVSGFRIRRDAQTGPPSSGVATAQGRATIRPIKASMTAAPARASMTKAFPTLGEVLGEMRTAEYEYLGDPAAEFHGFEVVARARTENQFFLLIDESWTPRVRRRFAKSHASRSERRSAAYERLKEAKRRGAAGFILSPEYFRDEIAELLAGYNVLLTQNTHSFAGALVEAVGRIHPECRRTAVTGSAGKSTTQQMIAHALQASGERKVLAPQGNRNMYDNLLVLLSQLSVYDHAVLEVSSASVSIQKQTGVEFDPDVAVLTQISESHADLAGSTEDIARLKSGIFRPCPSGGVAVINADAPHSNVLIEEAIASGRQLVTYGEANGVTVRLMDYDPHSGRVQAQTGQETYEYSLTVHGKHNAINSLAVIAVLRAYRIADIQTAMESLADFVPVSGRGDSFPLELRPGLTVTLLNEAFNANPASMRATISSFATHPGVDTRRIVLLGDILELGDASSSIHGSLAPDIQGAGFDLVLLFGEEMHALSGALRGRGVDHVYRPTLEDIVAELPELLQDGDYVLAKASHGTGLADWVQAHKSSRGRRVP